MMPTQAPTVSAEPATVAELMRFARDGLFAVDRHRRYVLFNEACERLTGYLSSEIVGHECRCGDVMECHDDHGRHLWGALCPAKTLFDGTTQSARQRMQIRRKDGSAIWVETVYSIVPGKSVPVEYVVGIMRDATEVKAREEELLAAVQQLRAEKPGDGAAATLNLDQTLAQMEIGAIRRALIAAGGHRHRAAELMGISRSRLYRRMEALGINPDDVA